MISTVYATVYSVPNDIASKAIDLYSYQLTKGGYMVYTCPFVFIQNTYMYFVYIPICTVETRDWIRHNRSHCYFIISGRVVIDGTMFMLTEKHRGRKGERTGEKEEHSNTHPH